MRLLDAEDRAAIAAILPDVVRGLALLLASLAIVLIFAVTAGMAVWLFRLTSGY